MTTITTRTPIDILDELDRQIQTRRDELGPIRGMHVPYHGPFCSAVPSVLKDLERLSKALRESLSANGLHLVDEEDMVVLKACSEWAVWKIRPEKDGAEVINWRDPSPVAQAEIARREKKTGQSQ